MPIRINENIFSLLVNRNLIRANNNLQTSYERLASGQRINKSGDDPSGLANSHLLRAKIAGLQRNQMNCNEGLNLLAVAESSLGNVTDILQRMRELAIQASSDTMGDEQRALIQKEIDELLSEIDRVATTANYNEKNLLDGTFTNVVLQVGTRASETMPLSIEDARTSILGSVARVTGASGVDANVITGAGDLVINGVTIPASTFDGISTVDGDASAAAKAEAINAMFNDTNVRAEVEPAEWSDTAATVSAGGFDGVASSLTINGVSIAAVNWMDGDSNGALRERINGFASQTGVTAALGVNQQLVLTAEDGRNVTIETTGGIADELGLAPGPGAVDVNTTFTGSVTLSSPETIQVTGTLGLIGLTAGQATTFVDNTTAIENLKVLTFEDAQEAMDTIDVAARQVLARRASLGALESRVNKTIEDLMLNIENLTGADSRIRDADFAVESTNLTQAQVIQEAGIAILSQANMVPRMALDLLKQ